MMFCALISAKGMDIKLKNIVFVILHYLTVDDTFNCISSIRQCCNGNEYRIIIVDNASPNESGKQLMEMYGQDKDVDLLILEKNLGFARGNNKGIAYAQEKYEPKYIVVLNNDIVLLQKNTIELIEQEYCKSKFSVLGPMIYTADGKCNDNPGKNKPLSLYELEKQIKKYKKNYFLCKWKLRRVYSVWQNLKNRVTHVHMEDSIHKQYLDKAYNVQLHGCFLCFSKDYFKCFDGFYSKTFLYMEEDILYYLTQWKKLTTVYLPELKVFHKEDSSSNEAWKSNRKRDVNKARYVLESAEEFRKLLLRDGNF